MLLARRENSIYQGEINQSSLRDWFIIIFKNGEEEKRVVRLAAER